MNIFNRCQVRSTYSLYFANSVNILNIHFDTAKFVHLFCSFNFTYLVNSVNFILQYSLTLLYLIISRELQNNNKICKYIIIMSAIVVITTFKSPGRKTNSSFPPDQPFTSRGKNQKPPLRRS